jgi:hypothetical protein
MPGPRLQRECACDGDCPKCRGQTEPPYQEHPVQTKHIREKDGLVGEAPPLVEEVVRAPGQSLDARTRAFMEPRFGHDFSQVRVASGAGSSGSLVWIGPAVAT